MNRHDIRRLQQYRGYPALTITLPTFRTAPQNRQDPIRVRNLVAEASKRLLGELSKREIEPLLIRLDALVNTIDFRNAQDGLVLFANHDMAELVYLPVPVKERVALDETFATRDLVYALHRSPRYWVLALSEQPTRLYEGLRDNLTEITSEGFPMTHEGPGGEAPLPGGIGVRVSAYRDERHRQFFRQVDAAFKPFMADDPLPLAVVGVDRFLSFFKELSSHNKAVVTTLTGSHDKTAPHELAKLVWPLVQANLDQKRQQAISDLDRAVSARTYASTVGEVWRMAQDGRGKVLFVEEDYHYPARVDESGRHLMPAEDAQAADVMDDAVDEIIEAVLDKQGEVVFVENGSLAEHQRIAMILRY